MLYLVPMRGWPVTIFKNIVQDANGQFSVSYADMHGRTVATALAGEAPKNADGTPMLDALSSQNSATFTKQLIDNETNRVIGNSIISSKPFVVIKDMSTYSFDYSLSPKQLSLLTCSINNQPSTTICYDCLYKLKFTISSDCDKQLVYEDSSINFTLGQYLNQCNNGNANQGFVKHFDKVFNKGSYVVTKTLTLSKEAQDSYRDIFLANDTCKKFIDFYTQQLSILQANSNCNMTCESCKAAMGNDFAGFRAKFVAESGTPEPLSSSIINQLLASFNETYANCDRMCNNNDGLDLVRNIKQMMLQDVTPPYGQYAQTDPAQQIRNYNIFKINDQFNSAEGYGNSAAVPDYMRPIKFSDNDLTVENTGNYFDELNQQETYHPTNPDEFAANFKTSWANQLLVHHPEFKKLQKTENDLKTSYLFEANLQKDTTWAQAANHGYITGLVDADPFFNGIAPAAYKQRMMFGYYNGQSTPANNTEDFKNKNPIIYGIIDYIIPHTASTCSPQSWDDVYVSMWQMALSTVFCRDKTESLNPCDFNYTDYTNTDTKIGCLMNPTHAQPQNIFSEGCSTDRDWAWKIFKTLYLTERKKLISAYLNTIAPTFPITFQNNNIPPFQLRFINHANPQSTFNNLGLVATDGVGTLINQVNSDINVGTAAAQNLAVAQYDTVCRGYANTWIAQLQSCPQINQLYINSLGQQSPTAWENDSTWLVTRLRAVCQRGADDGHFLGSSSVSPSNFNTYTINGVTFNDFPKVIQEFLLMKGIAQPNAECYPWLINVPKPYDKQPALANSYTLAKPTTCECDRISNLRFEWSNAINAGTFAGTFSAYLEYQHGTYISNEQLDALTALCTNNYPCKMLEKPIPLPPALQCRGGNGPTPKTCITCQDYTTIKADFFTLNNQHAPFANPQNQTEVAYNYSFAAFANVKTGFSKTWLEYLAFENACNAVTPPISCGSLDSTLQAFYLSPEYQQNPMGTPCVQVFVTYFNTHYQVAYTYNQWIALFQACSIAPNVCKRQITCTSFETLINGFYDQNGVQVNNNLNCQALFVSYINTQLSSNYNFTQLQNIYNYTCTNSCGGLNVCDFPNKFLLIKVYNAFKAANPQPWNLPNCQQAFVDYFNNYFSLVPALDLQTITNFYADGASEKCTPSISDLCNPPYHCNELEMIRNDFISNNPVIPQISSCQQMFANYFNNIMGTDYSYAQIEAIYFNTCHITLSVCQTATSCEAIIVFAQTQQGGFYVSDEICKSQFMAAFNTQFGTTYSLWNDLYNLYLKCGYRLDAICPSSGFALVVISKESLNGFLSDFKKQYPDPSTQLGNNCQDYFAARFNERFSSQYKFTEISAYYLQQASIDLDVCSGQCTKINSFIAKFNTQYAGLKLPKAAREDLFTFAYNIEFLNGSTGSNHQPPGMVRGCSFGVPWYSRLCRS